MSSSTCTLFSALFLAAAAAAQTGCLDQSYVPSSLSNGLEVTAAQPVTQTFTVGRTGQLTFVEVARIRHHNGVTTNPLTVAVVTTDATGTPTTTVLASVVVPPASITTASPQPLLVDVTAANVQVQTGQVLGLALTSPNAPGTPSYAWWGTAPGGAYAGGQIFIQQTIALSVWDLAFETWVSVPASWSSYGVGHPGTNGIPSLGSSANPVIGTTPDLLLGNSTPALAAGVIALGVASANVPTPFGGTLLVQPLATLGVLVPVGGLAQPFPIPLDRMLCGFEVFAQGVVLDAGASQGIAFSPGLHYVVGD